MPGAHTQRGRRAVALGLPLDPREVLDFDPAALPAEPLELRLLATGSLRVRIDDRAEVVDASGTPVKEVDVQFDLWTGAGGWARQYGRRDFTGEDGLCALWGALDGERIRVVALHGGGQVDALEARVGETGLVLRVPR